MTKSRLEEALSHKSDLLLKMTGLENKIGVLQIELEKKVGLLDSILKIELNCIINRFDQRRQRR